MSFFRFRWLHKLIRKHSSPIPEDNAALWKQRLSIAYAFLAWNALGFLCYTAYTGKVDWTAANKLKSPEELKMTPGQQWAQTLGKKNAEVYRVSGLFDLTKIETNQHNDTVEQSKEPELKH